jgi:hypothetical protein
MNAFLIIITIIVITAAISIFATRHIMQKRQDRIAREGTDCIFNRGCMVYDCVGEAPIKTQLTNLLIYKMSMCPNQSGEIVDILKKLRSS